MKLNETCLGIAYLDPYMAIDKQIDTISAQIEATNKKLEQLIKAKDELKSRRPNPVKLFGDNLVPAVEAKYGIKVDDVEVSGPFGLMCWHSISFKFTPANTRAKNKCVWLQVALDYRLIHPDSNDETYYPVIRVNTFKRDKKKAFPEGSIGAMNNMDYITKDSAGMTITEILKYTHLTK